jgi:hypothetical protein
MSQRVYCSTNYSEVFRAEELAERRLKVAAPTTYNFAPIWLPHGLLKKWPEGRKNAVEKGRGGRALSQQVINNSAAV